MKNNLIVAAAALMGTASAGVHKMKLEKVPLDKQFVCETCKISKEILIGMIERC